MTAEEEVAEILALPEGYARTWRAIRRMGPSEVGRSCCLQLRNVKIVVVHFRFCLPPSLSLLLSISSSLSLSATSEIFSARHNNFLPCFSI